MKAGKNYITAITDIFFDLDHTLWDFEKNSALAFEYILKIREVEVKSSDFMRVYTPINRDCWKAYRENRITQDELRRSRLERTFSMLGKEVNSELIELLVEDYVVHLTENNHLFQYAKEILQYLKSRYSLHIITNGFEEVQHKKLINSGIAPYFTHVVCSEPSGVKKPDPGIFHYALQQAGITAANAVMIGDDLEADIYGAQRVGMKAIHYNTREEKSEEDILTINNLLEIKHHL
ncbi:YjjG family noncanonical pyrimidine nucleotidase [Sinomicrobium sp.]